MGALLDFHILLLNINLDSLVHFYKYIIYSNNINIYKYKLLYINKYTFPNKEFLD